MCCAWRKKCLLNENPAAMFMMQNRIHTYTNAQTLSLRVSLRLHGTHQTNRLKPLTPIN
eukprot:m.187497 g.187497  ORF g.187497 m.187497 type:complete len:59 (+) comp32307_c0_seq1:2936-3112(+)